MADNKITVLITGNSSQLQSELSKTTSMVDKSFSGIGSIISGALSVGSVVAMGKAAIQMGDEIAKASQKFGIGAEKLSVMRYAAEMADVDFQGVGKALKFMAKNAADAATGSVESNNAFRAMGISVKDASGHLKASDVLFGEVARRMSEYKDSTEKTALVLKVFGRAGADIIPMLNEWGTSSAQLTAEAERLGVVLSGEQARRLEEYEHGVKKATMAVKGWAATILSDLGSALDKMAEKLAKMTEAGGDWDPMGMGQAQGFSRTPGNVKTGTIASILVANPEPAAKKIAPLVSELNPKVFKPIDTETWSLSLDSIIKRYEEVKNWEDQIANPTDWAGRLGEMSSLMSDFGDDVKNGFETALTAQQMFEAAFASGDVQAAITEINGGLGATWASLAESQSYISLYKQAWLDANTSIVDSLTSLYTGMQDWISSSIAGLVEGTLTIQGVLANLGKMLLQMVTDYIARWIVSRLFMTAMEKTIATTSMAMDKVLMISYVGNEIAKATASTGAGAARALSEYSWPYSAFVAGAVLAEGAAIIAGMTAGAAVAGAAHGGLDYVPAETTYLLDKGERVISPKQNEDLTDFLGNGGGGGQGQTIVLQLDGDVLARWINKNATRTGVLRLVPA